MLEQMSAADWRRVERFADFRAAGLVGVHGEDLLHHVITKLLAGLRTFPSTTSTLVVLKNAIKSEASNVRRTVNRGPIDVHAEVDTLGLDFDPGEHAGVVAEAVNPVDPLRELLAREQLDQLQQRLEGDDEAQLVAMAWGEGLRGKPAAEAIGLDTKAYDAARKRLERKIAQEVPRQ
jgi:hypothetical protein